MKYIIGLICDLCGGTTLINLALCLTRGRGRAHQKLMRLSLLLALVLLVRFGGGGLLALFGMGWRCDLRNGMNLIWSVLLIQCIWLSLDTFSGLPQCKGRWGVSVILSALGIELILLAGILYYLEFASWHDTVVMQNGNQIVVESNGHGTIGDRRAFLYVNSIVHGREVEYLWMS